MKKFNYQYLNHRLPGITLFAYLFKGKKSNSRMNSLAIALIIAFINCHIIAFAQTPQSFKYQTVLRTNTGEVLANQPLDVRATIENDILGEVYKETHSTTTNANGHVYLEIGNGTPMGGTPLGLSGVPWGTGANSLKIEVDTSGGVAGYQLLGTDQLLSVPYSLFAQQAANVNDADADPTNEIQNLNLNGTNLSITGGDSVDLGPIINADPDSTNELQTLSIVGDMLSISNGNSVQLPDLVNDADADPANELQTLTQSGDSLLLSSGGFVLLASQVTSLHDADNDTKIQVEANPDEDVIRFELAGNEFFRVQDERLQFLNNENSVFIGDTSTGAMNTTGQYNVAIGTEAMTQNTTGARNIAIGYEALKNNTTAQRNIGVGNGAMKQNTTGTHNLAIGSDAMSSNITGANNVAIGDGALSASSGGNQNLAVGAGAGAASQGNGNVFIGYQAGQNETGSNTLYIDNSNSSTPLLYGNFSSNLLRVNGTLDVNNAFQFPITDGTAGQALVTDGSGNLGWANATDNLGNHIAVQNVQLSGHWLSYDSSDAGVFIDTNGHVGINNNTPSGHLEVTGTDPSGSMPIALFTGNGNVGIGLTNPQQKLTVAGMIQTTVGGVKFPDGTIQTTAFNDNLGNHIATQNIQLNGNWLSGDGDDEGVFVSSSGLVGINNQTPSAQLHLTSGGGAVAVFEGTTGVGIGTTNPGEALHIVGNLRLEDGTQSNGYILISDSNGTASWQDPAFAVLDDDWVRSGTTLYSAVSGNVGIGTNAPNSKLHVDGQIEISGSRLHVSSGGNVGIGTDSPNSKLHVNGNIEVSGSRLHVEASGQVGIGTNNPGSLLHLSSTTNGSASGLKLSANSGFYNALIYVDNDGDLHIRKENQSNQLVLDQDGDVGFGLDDPGYRLHVETSANGFVAHIKNTRNTAGSSHGLRITAGVNSGTANDRFVQFNKPDGTEIGKIKQNNSSSVAYNTSSDRRRKTNIVETSYTLEDLLNIGVYDYEFIGDEGNTTTGFVAQQLYEHFPQAVSVGGEDVKTDPWMVDYGMLTPLLVKAIQDQQPLIDDLSEQIEVFENAQIQLMQEMTELENEH